MSSDFARPPVEERYLRMPQHTPNQDSMDQAGNSVYYHDPQAYSLQTPIAHALQHDQSMNSYDFDANSHFLASSSHGSGDLRASSAHGRDLPENSLASFFYPPTQSPAFGMYSTRQGFQGLPDMTATQQYLRDPQELRMKPLSRASFNGDNGSRQTIENANSDLEDGELSEGANHDFPGAHTALSQQSTRLPSTIINGTIPGKSMAEDISGRDGKFLQRRNDIAARAVNEVVESSANTKSPKQVPIPPNRNQHKNSLKTSQNGARHAVAQLQPHNIGYAQLLEENIHPELLKNLYSEFNVNASGPTPATTLLSEPATQATQLHPLPQKLSELGSEPKAAKVTVNESTPTTTEMEPSTMTDVSGLVYGSQQKLTKIKADGAQAREVNEKPQPQKQSARDQPVKTATGKPVTSEKLTLQASPNISRESVKILPIDKKKSLVPDVTTPNIKPVAGPVMASKPPLFLATNPAIKPSGSKAAAKPIDREAHIARLQAAKAGKVPSATSVSQPSLDPSSQSTRQDPPPNIEGEVVETRASDNRRSRDNLPANMTTLSNAPMTAAFASNAAAEAKKREQTELARRKIEELKNRSKVSKVTLPATTEVPTAAPVPATAVAASQPSYLEHQLMGVQSNQALTENTIPPLAHAIPQYSYFSSQNAMFSLPGLFMSPSQSQANVETEPVRIAPAQNGLANVAMAESVIFHTTKADSTPDQSVPVSEKLLPSLQEKQSPGTLVTSQRTSPQVNNNPRKRPTAADFIEPVTSKFRRSQSYKIGSSVVFEVSDDEGDESEKDTSDVQGNGVQDIKAVQNREYLTSRSGSTDNINPHQHPTLNDLHEKPDPNSRLKLAPHGSQTPTQKDSGGLRAREEEIERMNRKILEMEQRRKAKQGVSRAQTPGTPGRPTSFLGSSDSNSCVPGVSDSTRQPSESIVRTVPAIGETANTLNDGPEKAQEMPAVQRAKSIERIADGQPLVKSRKDPTTSAEKQQLRCRKVEIESDLSSIAVVVEDLKSRLETLHRDEADLRTQIQRQIDSKHALQQELDKLLPAMSPGPAVSSPVSGNATKPQPAGEGPHAGPGTSLSPQAVQDNDLITAEEPTGNLHEASKDNGSTTKSARAAGHSTPKTTLSADVPTNRSVISGELAEDVMDISGSEDEGEVAENGTMSHPDAGQLAAESDSEEPYEPPLSFGGSEQGSEIPTDSSKQHHALTSESLQQHDIQKPKLIQLAIDNSATSDMRMAVDDESRTTPPGYAQSPANLSESDDYEPPEPMATVDIAPVTSDAAASVSDSPFYPPDADQTLQETPASPDSLPAGNDQTVLEQAEAARYDPEPTRVLQSNDKHGHFIPYESPLQQFHAYRYHPDFVSRVGNGYRSLTYSHQIDARKPVCPYEIGGRCNDASCDNQHFSSMNLSDDMILVQMGAIPESLSEEQRNAFVVGLRQIIQEIRSRKVKDFKTVASEIAAYRARFLGDSSKILPL
ncbi:MAG: hypothetical protein Q9166_002434 [cf. Caloplaca sp. 2 TL-2023]